MSRVTLVIFLPFSLSVPPFSIKSPVGDARLPLDLQLRKIVFPELLLAVPLSHICAPIQAGRGGDRGRS